MSTPVINEGVLSSEVSVPQNQTTPLLGNPGDAAEVDGDSILRNLILGTGVLAQIGNVLFLLTIWATIFQSNVILFSGHPLAVSIGVFALIESILILQPTHTAPQKHLGQRFHAAFNTLTFLGLGTGVCIIEYNKFKNGLAHFHSVHAYFGVLTSILLVVQLLVGVTMWAVPVLYGSEQQAKSIWKYHRISGYSILILLGATIITATQTDYIANVVKIQTWSIVTVSVLIAAGVFPRLQMRKLGF